MVLANLAENALRLTGMGLCMTVPNKKRSPVKGLAIAAFSCAAGAVALTWISGTGGLGLLGLGLLGVVAWLAGFVVFLFFLRSLARVLRDHRLAQAIDQWRISHRLAQAIDQLLISYGVAIGVTFTLTCLIGGVLGVVGASMVRSPGAAGLGAGVFGIVLLAFWGVAALVFLGLFIRYILLVQQLRDAVDDHLQGS
jgi:hypothetical protein